jgi:hypothetical protein
MEKLPNDFVLDDEPVDNLNQPALAAALTESLELANCLPANALTLTDDRDWIAEMNLFLGT